MQRIICPCCHSHKNITIYQESYEKIVPVLEYAYQKDWGWIKEIQYELMECQNCSLIFQKYCLDDISLIYPSNIITEKQKSISNYPVHLPEVLIMLDLLHISKNKAKQINILDFGCGTGDFIKIVNSLNFNAFYSEIYENTDLERLGINGIDIFKCNLKFDYIYTNQVFEHLNQPRKILQQLTNVLSPRGIIKIEVPNGTGIKNRIKQGIKWSNIYEDKKSFNQIAPLEHINCFSHKSLCLLAKSCELKPISSPKNDTRLKRKIANFFPTSIINLSHLIPLNLYFMKEK